MDRFDAMQAFARVVETGSFTQAANTLHLSKTTVTQLVQQLEARLRVRLLNRTTRKVNLTAEGARYYEQVVRLLGDLQAVEADLSSDAQRPAGRLRVDVPGPLARQVLLPALPAFLARYPGIELDMGVSDRHVDLIDESVDCVIRGGVLSDLGLVARPLPALAMGVWAAPGYLDRYGHPQHPSELDQPPHWRVGFRGARQGRALPVTLHQGEHSVSWQGRVRLTLDDGTACLAAGLAGAGVIVLPCYMVREAVEQGTLVPLFEGWSITPMPLHMAWRPNRHPSARLRVFIEWVEQVIQAIQPASQDSASPG
ncbi:LysR family transcriptional regulator [Pseudomonas sp. KNUC1026]|uniref:LysR family transcriptional regulator n=1 Tax=Pseudomonas sp. KNUC1026 TaxID=2893890 RepID=UPI001F2A3342|nr:LysR family transcriptional regulator [Pseudomonas sp. KNUC1026]UFH51521.1 LysR family transcriptional regulator [Pseudomonas sp. KNUC1026]